MTVRKEKRDKTALVCHDGYFQYKRMMLGIRSAPDTSQKALDRILKLYKWKTCIDYEYLIIY